MPFPDAFGDQPILMPPNVMGFPPAANQLAQVGMMNGGAVCNCFRASRALNRRPALFSPALSFRNASQAALHIFLHWACP